MCARTSGPYLPSYPCWPLPWPMATPWFWCPARPVPSPPWRSARYSCLPAAAPSSPSGSRQMKGTPRPTGVWFPPSPLGNHGNPCPGIQAFTQWCPGPLFLGATCHSPRCSLPAPTACLISEPSLPTPGGHSLHPLGYGHLVASRPGERGDRQSGPPDPLPGFAPGHPGPVVLRICPGTLCFTSSGNMALPP